MSGGAANDFTHLNMQRKTDVTNSPPDHSALQVVDLYELPKTARVVVVGCLCIAKCLNRDKKVREKKTNKQRNGSYFVSGE